MEFVAIIIILVVIVSLLWNPFLKNLTNKSVVTKYKTKSGERSPRDNYNTSDASVVTPFVYQDLNVNTNDYDSTREHSANHSTDAYSSYTSDSSSSESSSLESNSYDSSSDHSSSFDSGSSSDISSSDS